MTDRFLVFRTTLFSGQDFSELRPLGLPQSTAAPSNNSDAKASQDQREPTAVLNSFLTIGCERDAGSRARGVLFGRDAPSQLPSPDPRRRARYVSYQQAVRLAGATGSGDERNVLLSSASFAARGEAGNWSTVACWPSYSRVSSTVSPSGNSSAS